MDSQLSNPESWWEVRCGVEPDTPSLFRPFRGQNVHECSREMSIGAWRSSDTVRVHNTVESKESSEGQIICKFYTSRCTARFLFYCSVHETLSAEKYRTPCIHINGQIFCDVELGKWNPNLPIQGSQEKVSSKHAAQLLFHFSFFFCNFDSDFAYLFLLGIFMFCLFVCLLLLSLVVFTLLI